SDLTLALGDDSVSPISCLARSTRRQRVTRTRAFACGQGGILSRADGGHEPLARGQIPEACACWAGENAMMAEDRADLRRWVMCGDVIGFASVAIDAGMVTLRV